MATSLSAGSGSKIPVRGGLGDALLKIGVIGYGYWGPNVVRNFNVHEKSKVVVVCDKSAHSLRRVRQAYQDMYVTEDYKEVLSATNVDAVAVVTPVWTHYELTKAALENGKHVFVEKPFTSTAEQAEELIGIAERKNLRIMVDHTFLFAGAVKRIRQLLDDGTLGDLYYYDSTRVNLGLFQHDVTVSDVALAKREAFISVEHLKRYTTLGMAPDQGKTSNVPRPTSATSPPTLTVRMASAVPSG